MRLSIVVTLDRFFERRHREQHIFIAGRPSIIVMHVYAKDQN
jgi:hypothetical protein